ncbi:MAG: hypothetical protein ACI4V5_08460 [Prevotella sp.]
MKQIIKNGMIAVTALLSMALTGCTDDYDYDPAAVETEGAYILAVGSNTVVLGENDQQSIVFTVKRHDDSQTKSYKLYCDDSNFNIPSEVTLEEGIMEKDIAITFNVPVGTIEKKVVIGIDDADAYTYGSHSQTYIVSRCKALPASTKLYSDFAGGVWTVDAYEFGSTVNEETGVKTCKYLIKEPFYVMTQFSSYGYGVTGDETMVFTINSKGKANVETQNVFTYYGYDVTAKGKGDYYSQYNAIQFLWDLSVPDLGGGFGSYIHNIYFPSGYNPLAQ